MLFLTPASRAVKVINLNNISQPDFMLMAEESVLVRVSMALISFSRNSATVPKLFNLMYSSNVLIAATAGEIPWSF